MLGSTDRYTQVSAVMDVDDGSNISHDTISQFESEEGIPSVEVCHRTLTSIFHGLYGITMFKSISTSISTFDSIGETAPIPPTASPSVQELDPPSQPTSHTPSPTAGPSTAGPSTVGPSAVPRPHSPFVMQAAMIERIQRLQTVKSCFPRTGVLVPEQVPGEPMHTNLMRAYYLANHSGPNPQVEEDYDNTMLAIVLDDLRDMRAEIQAQQDRLLRDIVVLENLVLKLLNRDSKGGSNDDTSN
jgi:hypothetical protein